MGSNRLHVLLVVSIFFGVLVPRPTHSDAARPENTNIQTVLAPSGKLRVGVYLGSPTSMVRNVATGQAHGVSFELGQELARRLGVTFEQVIFPRLAEIIEAIRGEQVDFTVTNATAARAQIVDFSKTLLSLELGFLVPAHSPAQTMQDIDKPGIRIGVARGSTSERTLPSVLKNASVVPTPTLKDAAQMIANREIDGFATNKAILFEMSDALQGGRILDGRWGVENLAVAMPKSREPAHDYVNQFVDDVQKSGLLARIIERAGLRGLLKTE